MTNSEIIKRQQIELFNCGVLKGTGNYFEGLDGNLIEEIEPIHTYSAWKQLGYQVKRNETAIAKFMVWKYVKAKYKGKNKKVEKIENTIEDYDKESSKADTGYCVMKNAAFFKFSQVERIQA